MNTPAQIAKHLREVYFGGNWTSVNLRDSLKDVSWQQAIKPIHELNSIAILLNHIHYYVRIVTKVLEGGPLVGKDKESFTHPPIASEEDWQAMQNQAWEELEHFAKLLEQLPEEQLWQEFFDPKYGVYYRNLHGIVEHVHYHLGQINIIKKLHLQLAE